jgi:hypothetical protein
MRPKPSSPTNSRAFRAVEGLASLRLGRINGALECSAAGIRAVKVCLLALGATSIAQLVIVLLGVSRVVGWRWPSFYSRSYAAPRTAPAVAGGSPHL